MKIGFCGSMSVGKTTLVNELKNHPEFKDYKFQTERSKYLRDLGIPLNTDSTFKGQIIFMAERASELLNPNIITDRTIIDVIAFSSLSESMRPDEKDAFRQTARLLIEEYDYIFYINPEGVEIEDNQVRETDSEYRNKIDNSIKEIISKNSHRMKKYAELRGTTTERIEAIKSLLFP
jgi:nicotinamide riboside kinase